VAGLTTRTALRLVLTIINQLAAVQILHLADQLADQE
jgi:hypothetical protein